MNDQKPQPEQKEKPPIILVDGSNVTYNGGLSARLHILQRVIGELRQHLFRVAVVVDARLRHTIDEPETLEKLIYEGSIVQVPAGRSADDMLLQLALRRQVQGDTVYILTNDMFPEKRAQGVVPRIAFVFFSFHGVEELIFSPSLESIPNPARDEQPPAPSAAVPTSIVPGGVDPASHTVPAVAAGPIANPLPEIDRELMEAFLNLLANMQPPIQEGHRLLFTTVAGYLHNRFEGDFCRRFSYRKPKEFALVLEKHGYIQIHGTGPAPLYLELHRKLVDELAFLGSEAADSSKSSAPAPSPMPVHGPVMNPAPAPYSEDADLSALTTVMELLRQENYFPAEFIVAAKLKSHFPGRTFAVRAMLEKGVVKGFLTKEKRGSFTCYWPRSGPWDAVDTEDPKDPYTTELWKAFEDSLHRLPDFRRTGQTRYHLARHLGTFGTPEIVSLPQARREHMVGLALKKKMLVLWQTYSGYRIDIPSNE
jgi:hypothetical protein